MRRGELAGNQLVGLAIQQPPLRVSDDHVLATDILQHRGGDFTGERAVRVGTYVLATEAERCVPQHAPDLLEVDERRTHDAVGTRVGRVLRHELLDEPRILGARAVHFPVSRDNGQAHESTSTQFPGVVNGRGRGMIAMRPPRRNQARLSQRRP